MTIAQQIINNCKKGLITIIQDDTENYMAFSNHKDYDGNYRTSSWVETIEETKRCIGETEGYSEKEIEEYSEEYNWKIVEVYREEVEPFKIGDKVKILSNIEKTEDWEDCKKYYPNMEGEINGVVEVVNDIMGLRYGVLQENGEDYWYISHQYLAPSYEEDDKNKEISVEFTLEEIAKKLGTDVNKIKIKI